MSTVLVVDDKEMLRDSVGATLRRAGYDVVTATDGGGALAAIASRRPDAVVTDLRMPGMSGVELVRQVRQIDEDLPVVMMTAFATVETAVEALKEGAFDYITKPFEGDELVVAVKRAIDHARLVRENAVLRSAGGGAEAGPAADGARGLARLVGDSPAMRRVKEQVAAIAGSQGTVLITGESGTGKEVVARAVHELSGRRAEPFLAVNCAALSESLLESELFGHERGAFTGADRVRKGRFELADRGTILLDEISEVSTRVQAKLLRVLQERAFERVGSSVTMGVDVRVVATSNRDLSASVAAGEFRQDLLYRLNVLPLRLPALRERADDIPALAAHFLAGVARREGRPERVLAPEALGVLQAYAWPGNVRELQNICERAAVLCPGEVIERSMIEPWLAGGSWAPAWAPARADVSLLAEAKPSAVAGVGGAGGVAPSAGMVVVEGRALEEIEREAIVQTLRRFRGHRQRSAQSLGIGVRTLGLKLKKWKQLRLVEDTL